MKKKEVKLVCAHCGKEIEHGQERGDDTTVLCCQCSLLYTLCSNCSKIVLKDGTTAIGDGDRVCADCLENHYIQCSNCGRYVHTDGDIFTVSDNVYCERCYHHNFYCCDHCGEIVSRDEAHSLGNGQTVCTNCFEYTCECASCGDHYPADEFEENDNDDNICERCLRRERNSHIHGHDFKPPCIFNHVKGEKTETYFGAELEIERKEKSSDDMGATAKRLTADFKGFVYCKEDGSLRNGFEIVTHPFTLDYMRDHWDANFKPVFDLKKDYSSWQTSTCGMHVHISRDTFTTLHLYKFLKFFYEQRAFIFIVSQRRSQEELHQWARFDDNKQSIIYKARNKEGTSRYQAVNLQSENTVEVRVFKGTLNPNSYRKNIEFCAALVNFTRDCTVPAVNRAEFLAFIREREKQFPHLTKFINEKFPIPIKESVKCA